MNDSLGSVEVDLRTCRENFERAVADKECIQRQSAVQTHLRFPMKARGKEGFAFKRQICTPGGLIFESPKALWNTRRFTTVRDRDLKVSRGEGINHPGNFIRIVYLVANEILEIDRLRQEKEALEMQHRVTERELNEIKEKLSISTRNLGSASGNIAQQESLICQLREEIKVRDDRVQRLQAEQKHTLESLAIQLSTPTRFVDSIEMTIKEKLHEVLSENKEKTARLNSDRTQVRWRNRDWKLDGEAKYENNAPCLKLLTARRRHSVGNAPPVVTKNALEYRKTRVRYLVILVSHFQSIESVIYLTSEDH
ncbi:hypothetical protein YQE_02963, partial [Dendroctonus ponderosae]